MDTAICVKALSLTQPWASLVATGAKRIETRTWPTRYRGPLAIHASMRFPAAERALARTHPFSDAISDPDALPRGAVIAVVDLVDCIRTEEALRRGLVGPREVFFGDYSAGRWAWILGGPRLWGFDEPAGGRMQLWPWRPGSDPLRQAVAAWLERGATAVGIALARQVVEAAVADTLRWEPPA